MALEQRRGETDEDYEARKKRVKRQRQVPLYHMYAHGGGGGGGVTPGPIPNSCIIQGTDLTGYGYDSSAYGKIKPDVTKDGQFIYSHYWQADGTFILQFGVLGNEQVPDVPTIFISMNGTLLQYEWDKNNAYYTASNLTLATQLIADYVQDEALCYTALPIPNKMISYDMNITDVDGTDTLINNTSMNPHFNAPVINATQNGPGSILVDGTTDIDTGFKPNLPVYSIEETVAGELEDLIDGVGQGTFTQRTEQRLLTHEENVLGDELLDGNIPVKQDLDGSVSTITSITDGFNFSFTTLGTGTRPRLTFSGTTIITEYISLISFDASINSGTCVISAYLYNSAVAKLNYTVVEGRNNITVPSDTILTLYFGSVDGNTVYPFDVDFTNFSQREVSTENKYYINGIEQATPALPDPDTIINLNDTAVIGYPDTIQSREAYFNVHTEVIVP